MEEKIIDELNPGYIYKCKNCGKFPYVDAKKSGCGCNNPKYEKLKMSDYPQKGVRNSHPTVKPIKLMSYLITMGSRPGDTILDPFAGSGTTGCAAITLGRKYIMIEKDPEYIKIIKARLKYWSSLPTKL